MDWNDYPNFTQEEFACKETGECEMNPEFMAKIQALRDDYRKPMVINSGYRSKRHSIEAKKEKPGEHTTGYACDIAVSGDDAYRLILLAMMHGFQRIGVNQKGAIEGRFIHLGNNPEFPNPRVWSY